MDMAWLGQLGFALPLGLGAIGSALGIGAAGQAAAGAWAKEAREGKSLNFKYIVLTGMPLSQTIYGFVLMIALGLLTNLLPTISTFSDTMSYIRLMAVGLASYYIAFAFNGLAMQVGAGGGIMWVFAAIILVLAHTMNVALGIIAVFAHGVRLNMLEFSSNAGVQWEGYPYAPFRHMTPLEKAAG